MEVLAFGEQEVGTVDGQHGRYGDRELTQLDRELEWTRSGRGVDQPLMIFSERDANSAEPRALLSRSITLLDLMLTSQSPASARRAPTVHFSRGRCANGSNCHSRMALRWVILLISSSGTVCK